MQTRPDHRRVVHVPASQDDIDALATRPPDGAPACAEADYADQVVMKPWGYEYLLFGTADAAGWVLFIQAGHATSMHCHRQKTTSLIVLDGLVRCSTLASSHLRQVGDALQIAAGAFHQTAALSASGAFVLEIESPQRKLDLVRLTDSYGREGTGYESAETYLACLDDQTTFGSPLAHPEACRRQFGASTVRLVPADELAGGLEEGVLACVVQGGGTDGRGRMLVPPGRCVDAAALHDTQVKWLPGTWMALVSPEQLHRPVPASQRFGLGV
jgi:quercetin dioxygenase-like cupin family protein